MQSWQCCRTCLSDQCLNPIFSMPEHSDKYTNIIYMATGLKVEINDSLPQEMCPNCIIFINESIKFRNKCEQTRKLLEERLNNQSNIKTEPKPFKAESEVAELDISEQLVIKDEFEAYDDNITLNNFGVKNIEEIADNEQTKEQADITKLDKVEQSEEVPFDKSNKDRENYLVKDNLLMERPAKTKQRKRKFVKEDIECEICHKILTSKLSYWKHSKIHTGFEVVCEASVTKLAQPREDLLFKKRLAVRRRKERIKNDPELHEKLKEKERQRYYVRKREGKIKLMKELDPCQQARLRKRNRENFKKFYLRKKHEASAYLEEDLISVPTINKTSHDPLSTYQSVSSKSQ